MSLLVALSRIAKRGRHVWKFIKGDTKRTEKILQVALNWFKFRNGKTFASEVHRRFNARAVPNARTSGYLMYSFLGISLVTQSTLKQFERRHDSDREISLLIQNIIHQHDDVSGNNVQYSIDDYALGGLIAKGCNGTVYEAKYKHAVTNERSNLNKNELVTVPASTEIDLEMDESFCIIHDEEDGVVSKFAPLELSTGLSSMSTFSEIVSNNMSNDSISVVHQEKDNVHGAIDNMKYDRALKIMFNYGESNELEIRKRFSKETLPSHYKSVSRMSDNTETTLPPHPNIVDMQCSFTGLFPRDLPGSEQFNMALPRDLGGCGKDHTLFLDMKRYGMTLKEYLMNSHVGNTNTSMVILSQLLEGIVHLNRHGIAHRDLKTDNILLDVIDGEPHLVISDFGCCLSSVTLLLDYPSDHVDKGGNTMLMAPEIKYTKPGRGVQLNYKKADLWAVGTVAYEIFGAINPFRSLKSWKYSSTDLPHMEVPQIIENLIHAMLRPNPDDRPMPEVVANAAQLILWAPVAWWDKKWSVNKNDVVDWIFCELFVQVCSTYYSTKIKDQLDHTCHNLPTMKDCNYTNCCLPC